MEEDNKNRYAVLIPHGSLYELKTFSTLLEAHNYKERMNFGNIVKFIWKTEMKESEIK